jgi:hypothetical protein
METSRSSQRRCVNCASQVHELSNTMTAVLMNAQLLERKLPPCSRLKRPVLAMERNAQRGGELLQRLSLEFGKIVFQSESAAKPECQEPTLTAVTGPERCVAAGETANFTRNSTAPAAPGLPGKEAELTLDCDPCTSPFFPKGDDGNEH